MFTEEGARAAWAEHQQIRDLFLSANRGPPASRPAATFDDVLRIHRRMMQAGLLKPTSGAMN